MDHQAGREPAELLVILESDRAAEALEQLHNNYRVSQVASPRVVIVVSDPGAADQARSIRGVKLVTAGDPPPEEALAGLDDGEVLFVTAWVSRIKGFRSKRRRGEGVSWDAPGFEPPDPPVRGSDPGETEQDKGGRDGG